MKKGIGFVIGTTGLVLGIIWIFNTDNFAFLISGSILLSISYRLTGLNKFFRKKNDKRMKENFGINKEVTVKEMIPQSVEKEEKSELVRHEPPDKRLLNEPLGMTLLEKHYFYEDQICAFYKRRNDEPKYIGMAIAACEKQIAIAKDVAEKMLKGKKRYTLKSDEEIRAAWREDKQHQDDLETIRKYRGGE